MTPLTFASALRLSANAPHDCFPAPQSIYWTKHSPTHANRRKDTQRTPPLTNPDSELSSCSLFSIILYCRILITLILATPRRSHFCVSPRLSVIAGCHKRIDDRMSELTNLHFGQAKRTGDKVCTAFDCLFYVLEMDRSQARGPSAEPVTPKCALSIYSCFRSCSRLAMVCEGLSLLLHSASRGL